MGAGSPPVSGRLVVDMRLTKHHGLGNDFLVLLDPDASHPLDPEVARALCARHTGVGADGAIRAVPATAGGPARVVMQLYNADGSRAEMSGNGIRCLAQALTLGWPGLGAVGTDVAIETDAGLRVVRVLDRLDDVTHVLSVAMGEPVVAGDAPEWTIEPVTRALRVDIGNPHLVLEVGPGAAGPVTGPAGDDVDLVALGEAVNAKVPGGANVHLVTPAEGGIAVRSYERGVGLTLACGTGACASAAAARTWGLVGDVVGVAMPGGRAEVRLEPGGEAVLEGPATYVGTVELGVSPWR
jgi:diaminopimelate epimerase